jgi:pimeloyl-ACP methyl ester carboxylesterase
MRAAFHALIVDELGVDEAFYHGHSLGGQFVLGYALEYPEAVSGLILEAPAGLEEFPETMDIGDEKLALFDPSYAHDFDTWKATWDPTGAYQSELGRTEQGVRDFFYFKERDPATGAVSPSFAGYFKNDSEYARLHTDQRVAMIAGNQAELEQWVTAFIYDVYTIGSELVEGDPDNLYQRLTGIEAPIFLAFGSDEPFMPSTSLNGLQNLANDVIIPFLDRMDDAGRTVEPKIYPGVGHFIHTDVPYEFATDTVSFMKTGGVQALSPPVIDALVNGLKAEAAPVAAAAGEKPQGFSK